MSFVTNMAITRHHIFLLLLFLRSTYGLRIDNQGKDFVVGFLTQHMNHVANGTNRLYLTSDTRTIVRVQAPFINLDTHVLVTPGTPREVDLPGRARMNSKTGIEQKGIRLTAKNKFSVYGMSLVTKSSEGFLGLPVSALGTDHVISTYQPVMSAVLLLVAPSNNTLVNIKMKITGGGKVTFRSITYGKGDTISLTLDSLQAFQVVSDREDLTGTRITSSKPIAVYSGNDCAYTPIHQPSCDHLLEQLPPVNLWGKEFITMATASRTAGDFFHVIAANDGTEVFIDKKQVSTIKAGQQHVFDSAYNKSHLVVTSKPSLVVKYAKGFSVDNTLFDPFMSIVPATNQYSNDYVVFVPLYRAARFTSFVGVTVNTTEIQEIKAIHYGNLNSYLNFTHCVVVTGTSYSVCHLNLTKDGSYRIFHTNPRATFALLTYGTFIKESYGFPAGLRIYKSVSGCVKSKMVPADGIDNDCDGRIDEEIFNGIDDDGDNKIDEDLVSPPPSLYQPANVSVKSCSKLNLEPSQQGQATGEGHGVCGARGPASTTFSDRIINKNECGFSVVRQWRVTDTCMNTKTANQYIVVKTSSKPILDFPKDMTLTCRARKYLTPDRLGKVKVLKNQCQGSVEIKFKDDIPPPCFTTARSLMREWTVKDDCGRKTTEKQVIRLLPLESKTRTRNFNVSIVADRIHSNETSVQSTKRIQNQLDKVLMLSLIGDVYLGSEVLKYRPNTSSNASADFLVKFDMYSSIMPSAVLNSLTIAAMIGQLRNVTQHSSNIFVQDFNECKDPDYHKCDRHAVCKNNVGSFNCSCLAGFVGNGSTCFARPSITKLNRHSEATKEENVTIRCEVFGIPTPEVSWTTPYGVHIKGTLAVHEEETLDDSTKRIRSKMQQEDGSLLITETSIRDAGIYTCIARNRLGEERMDTNLTVRKDQFMVHATVTLIDETFKTNLQNRESLRYRILEEELRTKLSDLFVKIKGFKRVEIIKFMKGSVKALFRVVMAKDKSTNSNHKAKAQVGESLRKKVATGYIGKLRVSKAVQLRGRPPAPINLTSSNIQSTSFKVHWAPPELHEMYRVRLYSLQYKEFGKGVKAWKTFASVSVLQHKLNDLEPGSSYMVRVKAHNDYGLSEPSEMLEIKTIKERSKSEWVVLILVPILVFIILVFLIVCIVRIILKKRRGGAYDPAAREEVAMINYTDKTPTLHTLRTKKFTLTRDERYAEPASRKSEPESQVGLLTGLQDHYPWRVLSRDRIILGDVLGEGQFGLVYKGMLTEDNGEEMPCAVKKLKGSATETDLKNLLNELEIMASVGKHENVTSLIGACPEGGPLLAVVEYAEHGSLLRYLRRHRRQNYDNMNDYTIDISAANRLRFACEISKGMAHLALMKCVHRDLATRNVLLGESLVAKVSDFGLSRDVYADDVYEKKTGGILPARWMAIESLELGLYSSASDVWSFGVVLWEIETGGATPFASYTVTEIIEHLKAGRRLGRPATCSRNLYSIMMRCWNANPEKRPKFDELTRELKDLYMEETMYVNVKGIDEDDNMNKSNTKPEKC